MPVQELTWINYCQQECLFLSSFHPLIIEVCIIGTPTHPNLTFLHDLDAVQRHYL